MTECKEHFDGLAEDFERNKARYSLYYDNVNKTLKELMSDSEQKNILDIGCGTGDILAYLKPKKGFGVDISKNMVQYAKKKYKNLYFNVYDVNVLCDWQKYKDFSIDYILCIHVMEHLEDLPVVFKNIKSVCNKDTKVIFLTVNPVYDFVLYIMEKLNLKMKEGNWNRMSIKQFKKIAIENGFIIEEEGTRFLFVIKYIILRLRR